MTKTKTFELELKGYIIKCRTQYKSIANEEETHSFEAKISLFKDEEEVAPSRDEIIESCKLEEYFDNEVMREETAVEMHEVKFDLYEDYGPGHEEFIKHYSLTDEEIRDLNLLYGRVVPIKEECLAELSQIIISGAVKFEGEREGHGFSESIESEDLDIDEFLLSKEFTDFLAGFKKSLYDVESIELYVRGYYIIDLPCCNEQIEAPMYDTVLLREEIQGILGDRE